MIDHERYRLLAAEAVAGPLAPDDERALRAHLATCHTCSAEAVGLERDQRAMVGILAEVPSSARVRTSVMAAAEGRRPAPRLPILVAAALLLLASVGAAVFIGGQPPAESPRPAGVDGQPTATVALSEEPSTVLGATPTPAGTSTASPAAASESPSPSPSSAPSMVGSGAVSGLYTYRNAMGGERSNSVAVRATDPLEGTWSRTNPDIDRTFGGPITCLVIDGNDAWLAGPATFASDGTEGLAALLYLHDGGSRGPDRAITWISDPGQTLETMETWCRNQFTPDGPYRVESGDIVVQAPP